MSGGFQNLTVGSSATKKNPGRVGSTRLERDPRGLTRPVNSPAHNDVRTWAQCECNDRHDGCVERHLFSVVILPVMFLSTTAGSTVGFTSYSSTSMCHRQRKIVSSGERSSKFAAVAAHFCMPCKDY